MRSSIHSFFLYSILMLGLGCANPISPTGGPKDTEPPVLHEEASTPNRQTFFKEREIHMVFNEWIQLDNVFNQLVVSPPLEYRPEIKAKGKELLFRFDDRETLLDSMTYTINFGKAVKDNTEGNKADDLRFVFSTGPVIDSLSLKGTLKNAFTDQPEKEIPVLLFPAGEDSVIAKSKPFYYAATDEDGRFLFENLRGGSYTIIALKDQNNDLQYNLAGESIAFLDTAVTLPDTSQAPVALRMSTPIAPVPVTGIQRRGLTSFGIGFASEIIEPVRLTGLVDTDHLALAVKDSLLVWLSDTVFLPDTIIAQQGKSSADTLVVPGAKGGAMPIKMNIQGGRISPVRRALMVFNQPVKGIDTSRIHLIDTSGHRLDLLFEQDPADPSRVYFKTSLREAQDHELTLLPGAVRQWHGTPLPDTLTTRIRTGKRADFGRLILEVQQLVPGESYQVEVLFKDEEKVWVGPMTGMETATSLDLDGYSPGNYFIRIIHDINRNGRWDPGDYWTRTQAEPVFKIPLGELRANWELKLEVRVPDDNGNSINFTR